MLTDPANEVVHPQLQPLLDAMVADPNPSTRLRWLKHSPQSTDLLAKMARGDAAISHGTFRALPSAKAYDFLRNWMVSVGILAPWEPHIDRFTTWLEQEFIPSVPARHVAVVQRFARWHVLRGLQRRAEQGTLTQAVANSARLRVRVALEFLTTLHNRGRSIDIATQADLDEFIATTPGYDRTKSIGSFVGWARKSSTNTRLTTPWTQIELGSVTISDEQRWADVETLIHERSVRLDVRLAGLFTLLFAQPLNRIVAMRLDQVSETRQCVRVAFAEEEIQMPPVLDNLLRLHTARLALRPHSGAGWLFPGAQPGRHVVTEVFRRELTTRGIKPYESRKAAMFQLAANMPAPILAELLGTTTANAAAWSRLAARDWNTYIGQRAFGSGEPAS